MENKIKNLLKVKIVERQKLNKEWDTVFGYSKTLDFSERMDKLEAEINLLELLLKE